MAHFAKLLVWEKSHALMGNTQRVAKGIRHVYDESFSDASDLISQAVEVRRMIYCLLRRLENGRTLAHG